MVSNESEKADALRQEVRAWLKANLPKGWGTREYVAPEPFSREAHELGKAWTKKLYDAGYTGFGYPKEYGGIERPPEEIAIINQELARWGTPGGPLSLGMLVAAPTILAHGQEWQKKRFLPKCEPYALDLLVVKSADRRYSPGTFDAPGASLTLIPPGSAPAGSAPSDVWQKSSWSS